MEFTETFFQQRLSHTLAAMDDPKARPANLRMLPRSHTFQFSRKRRVPEEGPRTAVLGGISTVTCAIDELVLEYGRSQREAEIAIAEVEGYLIWAPASNWKLVSYYLMSAALDPGLESFFRRNIRPGGTFLDIGASLGAYTVLAAILTGENGVVYSFEAAPEEYRWLTRNLARTGFNTGCRIRPQQVWIGQIASTAEDTPDSSAQNAQIDELVSSGSRVGCMRIGGHFAIVDVLKGMRRVCDENFQCRIVVDYCAALHPPGTNLLSIIDEIGRMGFSMHRIDSRTGEIAPLNRCDAIGAFSINLLVEQRTEMQCKP
jgi:hypothetical protein